jgi:hypothetical protein
MDIDAVARFTQRDNGHIAMPLNQAGIEYVGYRSTGGIQIDAGSALTDDHA